MSRESDDAVSNPVATKPTSTSLLEKALGNSIRKHYGFNVLFADVEKRPRIDWKKWETETQSEQNIHDYYNAMGKYGVASWGFVCGFKSLEAFDFDWSWVYRLWKAKFGNRAETLTVQTPNGGLRPHYLCEKPETIDKYKESLHVELKGPGRFVVYEGQAKREDGEISEYKVVVDKPIREDNTIILDTLTWLEEMQKRFHFLFWNCLRSRFSGKRLTDPDHNVRLFLADIMVCDGFGDEEIFELYRDFSDFNLAKTEYQINYTRKKVKDGLKPPTCKTLQETLRWNEKSCGGCERKRRQKYVQKAGVEDESDESGRTSQANHMVTLAVESGTELFHDDSRNCYAKITHSDAASILCIRSKEFRIWLSKLLWEARNKAPSGEALKSAINVLESKALFEGTQHKLYSRVAPDPDGDGIWIDMCDDKWRAIKVTAEGWQIVDKPPILFRRYSHQQPLVTPTRGGDPNLFFQFVNLAEDNEDNRILLIITVIHFLIPEIPHVILTLYGIQGAAKTTLLKLIRELIDPSSLGVLSIPRDEREMVQQLSHNWCTFYDNVGMLSWWQSDSLCRATTGGGFSKRELYTDDDDVIYNFYRCIGLNGINIVAQRPDLLDRCLLMGLKHIPKDKRKTEKTFWREFNKVKGEILGGFLDTLSTAIRIYSTINLEELYRMADFTKWGCAISEALGIDQKKFLSAYDASVESQIEEAAHSSPVAEVIPKFMDGRLEWEGSPSELYSKLVETAKEMGVSVRQKAWPKAPNSLIRSINELVPALKQLGYEVETKRRSGGARLVRINTVTTVTIAPDHENDGKLGIDAGDDTQGKKIPSSDDSDDIFQSSSGLVTTCWICHGLLSSDQKDTTVFEDRKVHVKCYNQWKEGRKTEDGPQHSIGEY